MDEMTHGNDGQQARTAYVDPVARANADPERWAAFVSAFAAAVGELANPPTNRTAHVTSDRGRYTFSYADLPSVLEVARPVLAKHQLVVVQTFTLRYDPEAVAAVEMRTGIVHGPSGAGISPRDHVTVWPVGSMKPQAIGSVVTYARRYSLVTLLQIAAEDDDDANAAEGNVVDVSAKTATAASGGRLVSPAQLKFLHVEMRKADKRTADVLQFVSERAGAPVEALEQIPQALFDAVLAFLRGRAPSGGER